MKNILKQAENAERLLKLTSDTMILLDKDGICVDIAVYNINLWFLKEDRLLGKNLFQLIPLSTYNQIYPDFKKVLTHKIRSTHNYEMALNGTTYFFKCIMSPFDGMVLCQYRDITERSQRKLELERKNQELNEIQKAALIGSWQYDSDTKSFKYAGHTGILCTEETQEIDLDDYLKLILPEDRKSFTNWLDENLKGKMENSVDYRILLQEKIFYIRLKAFAREYHKNKNTILEGYIQNTSEIVWKAERSNQLKSAFLANMSHEIRTPLNAILGFSRIIAETENAEERLQYYDIVEKNNMRLQELINEILDLSKIESGMMEFNYAPVSLYILCEDVKNTYSFRCQPGVELVFEESDPSLVISTDRNRLFQVFSNLIGNATKFTAKGSISFGYKLKEKEIVFHVADTGSGISDDKIDKIFDRFIMANNQVQGTGLGLSISKIIVEKLGGKIAVQSKMETGTTFTFTLPYISANGDMKWEEKLTPASIKDNNRTSHQEMTILVAEDYQSNYDLIEAMLGKMYKLVHAHDGMEAIIFYEQYKPNLILMDIKMPNINGLDATKAIREMSASVPVIAVSAYAYEKDKIAAIESGCNEFLTKPVSADLLKMTINKYLKQK